MLPDTKPMVDAQEQVGPAKETDVGNELNISLKRLSVQAKPDPNEKQSLSEI
jgi:hypothetical protein